MVMGRWKMSFISGFTRAEGRVKNEVRLYAHARACVRVC